MSQSFAVYIPVIPRGPGPDLLHDKLPSVRQFDSGAVVVMGVAHFPRIV